MPSRPPFDARLVTARTLSPSVRELVFQRVDGDPMIFEPGQWCNVFLPIAHDGVPLLKRSYSIASAPDGSPRFEIAVTRVQHGPGSTFLHALELGETLRFVGPHGFFTRPLANAPPSLMIATGTGVTPLRSMLRATVDAGESLAPTVLLLGVRREDDVLYRDEFETIARNHPSMRFEVTLSQPQGAWQGRRGYVQTHVRDLWSSLAARSAETPHAYVCGLERMVGSVRELLRQDMGVARQQVHSERYD
jgi:ferredoxin-NADP reductase